MRFARQLLCASSAHRARARRRWNAAFLPLLRDHVAPAFDDANRGPARYYVTLPFAEPFADPRVVFDPDVLAICRRLVGETMVMCRFATDTPLRGSRAQDVHRDSPGLFPERAAAAASRRRGDPRRASPASRNGERDGRAAPDGRHRLFARVAAPPRGLCAGPALDVGIARCRAARPAAVRDRRR